MTSKLSKIESLDAPRQLVRPQMNILFLAFEGEARLMARLAERFKRNGHAIFVVSCDHFNVTHSRGEVFDYYRSVGLEESEFANLDGVYRDLNSVALDLPSDAVDWNYLREFEHKYCRRYTLLELAAMDPLMSGTYHHRNIYFRPRNKSIFFKFLELQGRWLEGIFAKHQFDVVFTINFQYFVKAAAYTMAEAMGIPFLMAATCRINDLHLVFDNFSLGTPKAIRDEMARLAKGGDLCDDATVYVKWLETERRPAYADFELTLRTIKTQMSLTYRLREIWSWMTRYPRSVIFIHKHYRGLLRRNYFLPSYFASLRALIVGLSRRIHYFRHAELTQRDLPTEPFVFFPLHLVPENSVLTLSKTFDELECLFQLAKALPVNWKVVVKINPNMLASYDTHPNDYYREMSRIPNVQFVSPTVPSAAIIDRAAAVACISGTALLEGAVFGRPGFRWGRTEFEAIDTIIEFRSECVRDHLGRGESANLKYYLQACHNLGLRLDLRLLCHAVTSALSTEQAAEYERQLVEIQRAIETYLDKASANVRARV